MNFQRTFTSAPWEKTVGYCRALKAGPHIYVTGTAPVGDDGSVVALGDAYSQAKKCFQIIEKSLKELNVSISSVVRTRMFVTDISRWEEYGKAHAEFFGNHPPTTSMLEVKGLIDPDMLIEIEADAYVET
jgi:enamine deaminase RidA (YjgF/YER057c/UK114 family)